MSECAFTQLALAPPTLLKALKQSEHFAAGCPFPGKAGTGAADGALLEVLGSLPEGLRMQFCGSRNDVTLRSPRAHDLAVHMLPKVEVDTSKFCSVPCLVHSCLWQLKQERRLKQGRNWLSSRR